MDSDSHDNDIFSDKIHNKRSNLLVYALLLAAVVVAFLIGCYVIGPWATNSRTAHSIDTLSDYTAPSTPNSHSSETKAVPSATTANPASDVSVRVTLADSTEDKKTPLPAPVSSHNPTTHTSSAPSSSSNPTVSEPPSIALPTEQASSKLYRVRAGLFADRIHADELAAKLIASGFAPSIHPQPGPNGALFAVQVGAFRSKESAVSLGNSLKSSGFESYIISSD